MTSMTGSTVLLPESARHMVVELNIPGIRYETESLVRMLLGEQPVTVTESGHTDSEELDCISVTGETMPEGYRCRVVTRFKHNTREDCAVCQEERTAIEQTVCRLIYRQMTELLGHGLPWGMLTGVRPVKLVRQMAEDGLTDPEIAQRLTEYGVSPERVRLSLDTWHH